MFLSRPRDLYFIILGFITAVFALLYLSSVGHLSVRQFGLGLLALMACLFLVIYFRLRYRMARRSEEIPAELTSGKTSPPPELQIAAKGLRAAVVILPIILVVGFFSTRGQPLAPRLVGAAINLAFLGWFIFLLRRYKQRYVNSG